MTRGFPTNTVAALDSIFVRPISFAKVEFAAATLYMSNGIGSYTWGGNTYTGLGDFGSVSEVSEAIQVKPYALTLTLSGLDSTLSTTALTLDYYMRPVTLYLGCLDASDDLIDDPTQVWAGHVSNMSITVGETSEQGDIIALTAESELAQFDRSSNLKFTNQALQAAYSGDLGLEFLPEIEGKRIRWRGVYGNDMGGVNDDTGGNPDPDKHER